MISCNKLVSDEIDKTRGITGVGWEVPVATIIDGKLSESNDDEFTVRRLENEKNDKAVTKSTQKTMQGDMKGTI